MADVKRIKQLDSFQVSQQRKWQNAEDVAGSTTINPYLERPTNALRSPMVVTTRKWIRNNKYIVLWVNPSEMSWNMPRRETVTKTAAGAVRNTWRNRFRGTYYDEPMLNITFQTGNIMPYANLKPEIFGKRSISRNHFIDKKTGNWNTRYKNTRTPNQSPYLIPVIQEPPVPPGLQNFYDFIALIDQPILQGWGENRHVLFYRTQVFPRMKIEGYFTPEGLSFSESVDNANRLTWTTQFQVYDTSPKIWNASDMKMAYSMAARENGFASGLFGPEYKLGYDQIQAKAAADAAAVAALTPKLEPKAKTPPKRLVNQDGMTASDASNAQNTQDEQTAINFAKTLDAVIKKYKLEEPLKSKFIAEMNKLENQAFGSGDYVPRSVADRQAQAILSNPPFTT